jgi:hypothetical protein
MFCTQCGTTLTSNAMFCTGCGTKISGGSPEVAPSDPSAASVGGRPGITANVYTTKTHRRVVVATAIASIVGLIAVGRSLHWFDGLGKSEGAYQVGNVVAASDLTPLRGNEMRDRLAYTGDLPKDIMYKGELKPFVSEVVATASGVQAAPAIIFPKLGESVRLACQGVLTQGAMVLSRTAPAEVVLENSPPSLMANGATSKGGIRFVMQGTENAELLSQAGDLGSVQQTVEDLSDATKWDLTNKDVGSERSQYSSDTHVILDGATGHLEMHKTNADRTMSNLDDAYTANCRMESAADTHAREQAAQEKATRDNLYLAIAMHMPFKQGPVCDALRAQLIHFAQEPQQVLQQSWDYFFDRVSTAAAQTNCLAE